MTECVWRVFTLLATFWVGLGVVALVVLAPLFLLERRHA